MKNFLGDFPGVERIVPMRLNLARSRRRSARRDGALHPPLRILAALLLAALWPGPARAEPAPAEISIQLGWIANVEFMGEFVAVSSRYFEEEGLHCTLRPGGPTASVMPLVDSGKVLIGLGGADEVARARRQGARLKIVGATLQRNPTSIMSLASHPIRRPEELVGCRLGVPQANRTALYGFLRANAISPRSLTLIPVQNDPAPLVNGEIDAMVSFLTSQPIQLRLRGIDTVTLVLSDFHYQLWADDYVVTEDTLADPVRRSQVVRALRALARGWQAAVADPKLGARLAVTVFGRNLNLNLQAQELSAAAVAPLVATPETAAHGLLTMSPQGMAANVAALRAIGIDTSVPELFDPSPILEAYAGRTHF